MKKQPKTKAELIKAYGWWGEHPEYSLVDWRYEVFKETTRLGYWDWVAVKYQE